MQKGSLGCAKIAEIIKGIIFPICQSIFKKEYFKWRTDSKNTIAATFDDGPDDVYTEQVLDILDRYSIKATFFLVGENVKKYPDIAKKIVKRGHSIGIHTFTHKNLHRLKSFEIEEELLNTQKVIQEITGCVTNIMRPSEGRFSLNTIRIAKQLGLTTVLWTKSAKDYKMKGKDFILKRINSRTIKPGDILLFHDNNKYTIEALVHILQDLKKKKFKFGFVHI
ncbi:polysaccharide deacetylase family protein [bacterium]|nr:polysaccharide deacetylase family protein [bacterium]